MDPTIANAAAAAAATLVGATVAAAALVRNRLSRRKPEPKLALHGKGDGVMLLALGYDPRTHRIEHVAGKFAGLRVVNDAGPVKFYRRQALSTPAFKAKVQAVLKKVTRVER